MNDELKKALLEFATKMIHLVQTGVEEQLPLILQDIVGAALLSATVWWWFGLALTIIGAMLVIGAVMSGDPDASLGGTIAGIVFLFFPGCIFLVTNWYAYLYATRFPRLVILDYLRRLL